MKAGHLIRQFLRRKKDGQPGYSLRALARDLKVSPSFLSEVLSGKKNVPPKWIKPLSRLLDLDEIAVAELRALVAHSHLRAAGAEGLLEAHEPKSLARVYDRSRPIGRKQLSALTKWYYVAVLDFLTLNGGPFNAEHMAKRLSLSPAAITEALGVLENLGLIAKNEAGGYEKTDAHIRFPTSKSDPTVRNFHLQMIEKAKLELLRKTEDANFAKRLIFGTTIAADEKHLAAIKKRLHVFMSEISEEFSAGQPTELYQFNLQLFALTKS
jgi:uncharacterized protein (TIGR02147 family)